MLWYEKLGFETNPFSIRPTESNNLIGYEKIIQRIIYQVKIGNVIFLEGSFGTGKSSILKSVRKKFSKNALYFNCASGKNIGAAIMKRRSFLRKLFFLKPKQLLLFLDETHMADPREFDFLYESYIMDSVKSIVFAGTNFKNVKFNKAFKADTKQYLLNEIKQNLAIEILKGRMPEQTLFTAPIAKKIFELSHKNPREYLEALEDLARVVVMSDRKKVTSADVNEYFKKK